MIEELSQTSALASRHSALGSGLLFYGYDMATEQTPLEVGLGFTINTKKGDFRGKDAVLAAKGNERLRTVGLIIDHEDMVNGTEMLSIDGSDVGVVNSPCFSHRMNKSLALSHIATDVTEGTIVTVTGDGISTTAIVTTLPFYDPKNRTHIVSDIMPRYMPC